MRITARGAKIIAMPFSGSHGSTIFRRSGSSSWRNSEISSGRSLVCTLLIWSIMRLPAAATLTKSLVLAARGMIVGRMESAGTTGVALSAWTGSHAAGCEHDGDDGNGQEVISGEIHRGGIAMLTVSGFYMVSPCRITL
jgi:hypothetical protein